MDELDSVLAKLKRLSSGYPAIFTNQDLDALHMYMVVLKFDFEHLHIKEYAGYVLPTSKRHAALVARNSLSGARFRCWINTQHGFMQKPSEYDDRYWGMKYLLGEHRLYGFIQNCQQLAEEAGWHRIGKNEYSRGRGLQQAVADLFALIVFRDRKFEQSLNRRVWTGYRRAYKDKRRVFASRFNGAGIKAPTDKKWRNTASVPPGTLIKILDFLGVTNEPN